MTKLCCCVALLGATAWTSTAQTEITAHAMLLATTPTATWHNATSFGGHIYSAHETNAYIKYLGNFSSASQCLDACVKWDAQPGAKCRALDWYSPKARDPHSQGCYARIDGVFEDTPQPGVTSAVLDWPCVRDEDCSLNGVCGPGGACKCDPQWGGADCGELRLLPAPRGGGLQSPTLNYWGGNPFFSQGLYHVFGTEILKGCQIGDFLTNSQVVHATSTTPLGPYVVNSTWLEPFAHTPRAWPGPNNSLLIAYVGRQFVPPAGQRNCAAEAVTAAKEEPQPPVTRTTVGASDEAPAAFPQRNPQCLGLMVAQSRSGNVSGPWLHRFVYDPSYEEWYGRIDDPPPTCRDATSTSGCHVDVCAPNSDGSSCWHSYYKGKTAGVYSEKAGLCCKGGGGCGPHNAAKPKANATFAEAKAACDALENCSSFCFTGLDMQPATRVPVMWKSAASGFSPNPPASAPGDGPGGGSNYMEGGINNPSIFLFPNGTSLIAARTCTWPEQVVVASAPHWRGPYKSVVDGPAFGGNPNPSDE